MVLFTQTFSYMEEQKVPVLFTEEAPPCETGNSCNNNSDLALSVFLTWCCQYFISNHSTMNLLIMINCQRNAKPFGVVWCSATI